MNNLKFLFIICVIMGFIYPPIVSRFSPDMAFAGGALGIIGSVIVFFCLLVDYFGDCDEGDDSSEE